MGGYWLPVAPRQRPERSGRGRAMRRDWGLTSDAMVDSYQLFAPEQRKGSCRYRDTLQRCAHARAFGIAYATQIIHTHACLAYCLLHEPYNPCSMVLCCVLGEEAFAGRRDICVSKVCENYGGFVWGGMRDDADTELVGAAFEADCYHGDISGRCCTYSERSAFASG